MDQDPNGIDPLSDEDAREIFGVEPLPSEWRTIYDSHVQGFLAWLPESVRKVFLGSRGVVIAGGALRAYLANARHSRGERAKDIDVFINGTKEEAAKLACALGKVERESRYAITVAVDDHDVSDDNCYLQVSAGFKFTSLEQLLEQFDFSVCQAAIWIPPQLDIEKQEIETCVGDKFYGDLAHQKLRFIQKGMPVDRTEVQELLERTVRYYCYGYRPAVPDYAESASPEADDHFEEIDLWKALKDRDFELRQEIANAQAKHQVDLLEIQTQHKRAMDEQHKQATEAILAQKAEIEAIKSYYSEDEQLIRRLREKVELARIENGLQKEEAKPVGTETKYSRIVRVGG